MASSHSIVRPAPPLVETPRLVLSVPVAADAELVFRRYAGDADVTRYLGWPTHYVLASDAWGKGCATEMLNAMVDVAGCWGSGVTYPGRTR